MRNRYSAAVHIVYNIMEIKATGVNCNVLSKNKRQCDTMILYELEKVAVVYEQHITIL